MITDVITIDKETEEMLNGLWSAREYDTIPSDLFYANTIPLRNFAIEGRVGRFEFEIYDEPAEWKIPGLDGHVDVFMKMTTTCNIGKFRGYKTVAEIGGTIGTDFADPMSEKFYINGKEMKMTLDASMELHKVERMILKTWYGVQIAMLHPVIKEVFARPQTIKERVPKDERKDYGQKVYRYVKHHIVNSDELDRKLYGKGEFHRHALIWYVTGHWRNYKNGKTTFVQGYWKGALRETKQADARKRELVVCIKHQWKKF